MQSSRNIPVSWPLPDAVLGESNKASWQALWQLWLVVFLGVHLTFPVNDILQAGQRLFS